MSEKKGAAPSTKILTRDDIERIRDEADYAHSLYVDLIRDLATTALGLMDEWVEAVDEVGRTSRHLHDMIDRAERAEAERDRLRSIALQNKDAIAGGSFTNLGNVVDKRDEAIRALRTAEARIRALEEGLRDIRNITNARHLAGQYQNTDQSLGGMSAVKSDTLAKVHAHSTALLSERDSPNIEVIATHVDNPEKGGSTERDETCAKCGEPRGSIRHQSITFALARKVRAHAFSEWSENVKGRYTIKPAITVEDSPAGPVTVVKMRPALTERDMEKGGAAG